MYHYTYKNNESAIFPTMKVDTAVDEMLPINCIKYAALAK